MDILILHGAIGAAEQLTQLKVLLAKSYKIHTLDFTGHGGQPLGNTPFSIRLFADDVLHYLDSNEIDKINLLGYSMGGYVGLYLAKNHPERIDRIITIATKYHWDEAIAAREIKMLDPEKITQKLPAFAATLQQRHAPGDWKEVLIRTAQMMLAMGADNPLKPEDYASITHPTLVMLGDRDKMVTLEETVAVYKALPNAQLCVLPGTPHPIEQVNITLLTEIIEDFLKR